MSKKEEIIFLFKNGESIEEIIEKGYSKKYVKEVVKNLFKEASKENDEPIKEKTECENINDDKEVSLYEDIKYCVCSKEDIEKIKKFIDVLEENIDNVSLCEVSFNVCLNFKK